MLKSIRYRIRRRNIRLVSGSGDNAQGVGTMTYIDSQGNFGALGHGINDVDTSNLMEMNDGTLYQTEIISIQKGTAGHRGNDGNDRLF